MKFSISSSALLKQLQHLSPLIESKQTIPIIECFAFYLTKNSIKIVSSNLETVMEASLAVDDCDDTGSICIPARILMDTLKTFSDQLLTFDIDEKKYSINISSSNGSYKLTGFSGDEFPKMPTIENASSIEMESESLLKIINNCIFAVSSDELRPSMCGISFNIDENGGVFVATDANKLVKYVDKDAKSSGKSSYIVPKKPLQLLKSIAPTGTVAIDYNNTNVSFTFDNIVLMSRLVDGKYPNYEAVIPKENPNKLIIDRGAFLSSIRRVCVFSNKTTNQIKLEIKKGKDINIVAEDLDFSNSANEELVCDYKGEDITIGFNGKYLSDMLSNLDCEEVLIEMSEPNKAAIMKPNKSEIGLLHLLMPIMLTS